MFSWFNIKKNKKYSQKGCIEVFRKRQFMFKERELVRKLVYFSYNVEIILFVFPIVHWLVCVCKISQKNFIFLKESQNPKLNLCILKAHNIFLKTASP